MAANTYWSLLNKYLDDGKDGKKKKGNLTVVMRGPHGMGPKSLYTGAGPDGVVQPNKPAAVDYGLTPPRVYHEDEVVKKGADGELQQVQPSPMTVAKTEQDQQQMGQMQKMQGWPGYEQGYNMPNPWIGMSNQIIGGNRDSAGNRVIAGQDTSNKVAGYLDAANTASQGLGSIVPPSAGYLNAANTAAAGVGPTQTPKSFTVTTDPAKTNVAPTQTMPPIYQPL